MKRVIQNQLSSRLPQRLKASSSASEPCAPSLPDKKDLCCPLSAKLTRHLKFTICGFQGIRMRCCCQLPIVYFNRYSHSVGTLVFKLGGIENANDCLTATCPCNLQSFLAKAPFKINLLQLLPLSPADLFPCSARNSWARTQVQVLCHGKEASVRAANAISENESSRSWQLHKAFSNTAAALAPLVRSQKHLGQSSHIMPNQQIIFQSKPMHFIMFSKFLKSFFAEMLGEVCSFQLCPLG